MGQRSRRLERKLRKSQRRFAGEPLNKDNSRAPITKFPVEILSEIFKIAVDEERANLNLGRRGGPHQMLDHELFPLAPIQTRISHVCGQWRAIAVGDSDLWTRVTFRSRYSIEQAEEWVNRAKERPVDIVVDLRSSRTHLQFEFGPFEVNLILDFIISIPERWRSFELSMDDGQMMYAILTKLETLSFAPNLEEFTIYCTQHGFRDPYGRYSRFFIEKAPKLRALRLWGVYVDLRMWAPELFSGMHSRWSTLQELSLSFDSMMSEKRLDGFPEFFNVLRTCCGLGSLHLKNFDIDLSGIDPQLFQDKIVSLPNLHTIELADMELRDIQNFLMFTDVCNLRELILSLDKEDFSSLLPLPRDMPPYRTSTTKFMQIIFNIRILRLKAFACCREAAIMLYLTCENVEQIYLDMDRVMPDLLPVLQLKNAQGGVMCPRLRTLTLANLHHLDEYSANLRHLDEYWQLYDVAKTRLSFGSPLINIELDVRIDLPYLRLQSLVYKVETVKFIEIEGERDEDDEFGAERGRNAIPRPYRPRTFHYYMPPQFIEPQEPNQQGELNEEALLDLALLFEVGEEAVIPNQKTTLQLDVRLFRMSIFFSIFLICFLWFHQFTSL